MAAIIFDLDGTLADTSKDLLNAANLTFKHHGFHAPFSSPKDRALAFGGGRRLLTEGLIRLQGRSNEAFVRDNYKILLEFYQNSIADYTCFYEGALDAIEILKEAGHRIGICTNKPIHLAEQLLKTLNARHYFEAVLGADSLPVKKPDPAHYFGVLNAMNYQGASLLIGDTLTDLKTAHSANVPCILCDFGDLDKSLLNAGTATVMQHYRDLPLLIETIFNHKDESNA